MKKILKYVWKIKRIKSMYNIKYKNEKTTEEEVKVQAENTKIF